MASLTSEYLELISQLQTYIQKEYPSQAKLEVSRESYLDYRQFALSLQQGNKTAPVPTKPTPPATINAAPKTIVTVQPPKPPSKPSEKVEGVVSLASSPEVKKPLTKEPIQFVPKAITLEVPIAVEKEDLSDIQKAIISQFPQQPLLDQPPDDALAVNIKNKWKNTNAESSLTLLIPAASSHPLHQTFLANVIQAVHHIYQLSCAVVEKKNFQGNASNAIELLDLDLYLREPHRKRDLWNEIKKFGVR